MEVASTVRGLAAGKKITEYRGEQMLADYSRPRVTRPVWPYLPRMWELRHNLGAYDAAYIALAEALGCELLDRRRQAKERRRTSRGSDRLPLAIPGAWIAFPARGALARRSAQPLTLVR